jgi:hypothetical protein
MQMMRCCTEVNWRLRELEKDLGRWEGLTFHPMSDDSQVELLVALSAKRNRLRALDTRNDHTWVLWREFSVQVRDFYESI